MPAAAGSRKTRKKRMPKRPLRAHPPQPGPAVCSPLVAAAAANAAANARRTKNSRQCLPKPILSKVISATSRGGSLTTKNLTKKKLQAIAEATGCSPLDERCLIEKSLLSQKEKTELLSKFFRPEMPKAWKSDPDMWLNSDDIAKVMKQYEVA